MTFTHLSTIFRSTHLRQLNIYWWFFFVCLFFLLPLWFSSAFISFVCTFYTNTNEKTTIIVYSLNSVSLIFHLWRMRCAIQLLIFSFSHNRKRPKEKYKRSHSHTKTIADIICKRICENALSSCWSLNYTKKKPTKYKTTSQQHCINYGIFIVLEKTIILRGRTLTAFSTTILQLQTNEQQKQ